MSYFIPLPPYFFWFSSYTLDDKDLFNKRERERERKRETDRRGNETGLENSLDQNKCFQLFDLLWFSFHSTWFFSPFLPCFHPRDSIIVCIGFFSFLPVYLLWAATTPSNMWCTVGLFVQVCWRLSLILKMAALIQFESTLKWHKNFKKKKKRRGSGVTRSVPRDYPAEFNWHRSMGAHIYIYNDTECQKNIK